MDVPSCRQVLLFDLDALNCPSPAAVAGVYARAGGTSESESLAQSTIGLVQDESDVGPAFAAISEMFKNEKGKLTVGRKSTTAAIIALGATVEHCWPHAAG